MTAPVLAVTADLHFAIGHDLVDHEGSLAGTHAEPGDPIELVANTVGMHDALIELDAVVDPTAVRAVDRTDEVPVGDPVRIAPFVVANAAVAVRTIATPNRKIARMLSSSNKKSRPRAASSCISRHAVGSDDRVLDDAPSCRSQRLNAHPTERFRAAGTSL